MAWIWAIIALVSLAYILKTLLFQTKKLPPGPKGFPIFGCFHLLGKFPHRDLSNLSQKYGPIMHMRLGFVPAIIVSSGRAAELFLKTHDLVFASRPLTQANHIMSYGQKNLVFAQYGSYWRNIRKMCTLELLSNLKVNSFQSMRREELGLLIEYLREAAKNRVVVDLSSKVSSLSANITCLMTFGKKYEDNELDEKGFKNMMLDVMYLAAAPNLGDYIPFIKRFDFQGLAKRMKSVSKVFDSFFERIIDEHLESMAKGEVKNKDFVDVMLKLMDSQETEYPIDRDNIKAIIFDMLGAGMDTSATAIGWALAELIKNPQVIKKMQDELEKVVGLNRMVEESDLENLEYLDMVVKETLRLYPPAPLLIPHESLEDCTINGFHIPKKSRIIVNAWAIGRDPNVWTEPEKFFPERFMGNQVDMRGRDFQIIPFGSGRRGCPGIQMGLIVVRLILAQLFHCFDWNLPNNMSPDELDMTEEFGITCPRAQDLMVIPTYRLCI